LVEQLYWQAQLPGLHSIPCIYFPEQLGAFDHLFAGFQLIRVKHPLVQLHSLHCRHSNNGGCELLDNLQRAELGKQYFDIRPDKTEIFLLHLDAE
jgi:hypothetical protein